MLHQRRPLPGRLALRAPRRGGGPAVPGLAAQRRPLGRAHAARPGNLDDVVIIEVDSHFTRLADGQAITVSCTDIYRMQGLQIRDWRVYADYSPFGAPIPAQLVQT